ncbi:MAG: hypothetical protein AAGJ18_24640, partial [Bacteroidota bacterium]
MSKTIIGCIVFSLLGLIVIQIGMLRIGFKKEMIGYDSEARDIMRNVSIGLFNNTELNQDIATLSREVDVEKRTIFTSDSLPFATQQRIDFLFKKQLAARDIAVEYAFAITDEKNNLILGSENFNADQFKFNFYTRPLGVANEICQCDLRLHFHQKSLSSYLFSRLAYLLIPSLLFL